MKHCTSINQYHFVNTDKDETKTCTGNRRKISIESDIFSPHTSKEELLNTTKGNIILTSKGLQIYGGWSEDKLLRLLTDRLTRVSTKQVSKCTVPEARLHSAIHSGLYSTCVLKELKEKGMSSYTIIKAMKLGLISLTHCELSYLKKFRVDPYVLQFENMWIKKFDEELIANLRTTGLTEHESWRIVIFGVIPQNADILCRLILSGIDVPGILSWQSPVKIASPKIILFLRHIGMEENVVKLVEQYGIDDETQEMLIDLGYIELDERHSDIEEILCECSLTELESNTSSLDGIQTVCKNDSDASASLNTPDYIQRCICKCGPQTEEETLAELTAQRNDYLRQNVMVPLAWAMGRALRYGPTDPKYYIAYQLLRWKYGSVSQMEKDSTQESIAFATIAMDRELTTKVLLKEKEFIKNMNERAIENIPCELCKDHQQLYRIKKQCWKCTKKLLRKQETCKFPEMCSSCKIDSPDQQNDCEFPQMCSSCKIDSSGKQNDCEFPEICSSCKIDSSGKQNDCEFPEICSFCKVNWSDKQNDCEFPEICSSCKVDWSDKQNDCEFPEICSSCKIDLTHTKE